MHNHQPGQYQLPSYENYLGSNSGYNNSSSVDQSYQSNISYNSQTPNYGSPMMASGYNYTWNRNAATNSAQVTPQDWKPRRDVVNGNWNQPGPSKCETRDRKGQRYRSYLGVQSRDASGSWKGINEGRGKIVEGRREDYVGRRALPESRISGHRDRKRSRSSETTFQRMGYSRNREDKYEGYGRERSRTRENGYENEELAEEEEDGERRIGGKRSGETNSRETSRIAFERIERNRSQSRDSRTSGISNQSLNSTVKQKSLSERDQLLEKYR